jgi:hypothetical protein
MANNEMKKTIPISTIPSSKLTVILNNFIVNTANHLNKLSVNVDQKLSEFDKKMNDLEIMTTLFEAKLESLPDEIKSQYPPLQECSLDDVNPVFSSNSNNNIQSSKQRDEEIKPENKDNVIEGEEDKKKGDKKEEDKKKDEEGEKKDEEGEKEELSPIEDLQNFLSKNMQFESLFKSLKYGVHFVRISQQAKLNGVDMDLLNEMYEKAKKAYPEKIK